MTQDQGQTTAVPIEWAVPEGEGPHPAIVLLHEAFGVNDHMKSVAARLAAEGYVVAAPSLFHRLGVDTLPYAEHERAVAMLGQLAEDDVVADMRATYDQVVARDDVDATRVAALGFCFGGRCAFLAAATLPLAASVSFYGPGIAALVDRVPAVDAPLFLVFGEEDPLIPADARAAVTGALEAAGKPYEVFVASDAGHAFFNDARADRYQPDAAAEAWKRALAFLDAGLGRP